MKALYRVTIEQVGEADDGGAILLPWMVRFEGNDVGAAIGHALNASSPWIPDMDLVIGQISGWIVE